MLKQQNHKGGGHRKTAQKRAKQDPVAEIREACLNKVNDGNRLKLSSDLHIHAVTHTDTQRHTHADLFNSIHFIKSQSLTV